jgi:hypothetical protein
MVTSPVRGNATTQPQSRQPVEPAAPVPEAPRRVRTVARRRGALVGVGLALVALGALAFLYVSGQLSTAVPVIAVVNDVQRGAVIDEGDVGVASVVPDPALAPVPADRIDEVVGLRAATDLVAGSLLAEASVTAAVVPAAGEAVVGVALTPGQMPGEPLLPGDVVLVVGTPGPGDATPVQAPAPIEAAVLRTYPAAGPSEQVIVDVLVSSEQAADLVSRVATGRIGVVLTSRER